MTDYLKQITFYLLSVLDFISNSQKVAIDAASLKRDLTETARTLMGSHGSEPCLTPTVKLLIYLPLLHKIISVIMSQLALLYSFCRPK